MVGFLEPLGTPFGVPGGPEEGKEGGKKRSVFRGGLFRDFRRPPGDFGTPFWSQKGVRGRGKKKGDFFEPSCVRGRRQRRDL